MSVPAIFQTNVPAHLSTMSRETIAALNKDAAAGAGGSSIPRISLKQSRFRMIVGGEEVAVLPSFDLDVVVIHANPAASKTFYGKQWTGNDDRESPDCFSNDGIRPHTDAKAPQCASCAQCPHNAWGSKINPTTGAQGKACTDTKRIAVVAPGVLGTGDLFQLAIPPASLKEWAGFIGQLQQVNPPVPYFAIVTKISFDTNQSYPKLLFTPVRYLSEAEFAIASERFSSEEAGVVAGLDNGPVAPQVAAPAAQSLVSPEPTRSTRLLCNKPRLCNKQLRHQLAGVPQLGSKRHLCNKRHLCSKRHLCNKQLRQLLAGVPQQGNKKLRQRKKHRPSHVVAALRLHRYRLRQLHKKRQLPSTMRAPSSPTSRSLSVVTRTWTPCSTTRVGAANQ